MPVAPDAPHRYVPWQPPNMAIWRDRNPRHSVKGAMIDTPLPCARCGASPLVPVHFDPRHGMQNGA